METDDPSLANGGSDHEMTSGTAADVPPARADLDADQPLANDCTSRSRKKGPIRGDGS